MRPTAVGYTLCHLAGKCASSRVVQVMNFQLTPYHLGYGVSKGTAAAAQASHLYLDNMPPDHLLIKLDFSVQPVAIKCSLQLKNVSPNYFILCIAVTALHPLHQFRGHSIS